MENNTTIEGLETYNTDYAEYEAWMDAQEGDGLPEGFFGSIFQG